MHQLRTRAFVSRRLLLSIAILVIAAGAAYGIYTYKNTIVFSDTGSTNTPGWTFTISPDGSGKLVYVRSAQYTNRGSYTDSSLPAHSFDELQHVVSEIGNVGKIQLEVCGKSASFGSRTYISYRGETSGDIQCVSQNAPEPQPELNKALADAMLTIACYQNEGSYCQTIDEMKTSGIDSGIEGSVWAVPVPYCHNPAPLAPGDNNPCGITDNFSATFLITKSDGTTVKKVTTDAGGNLDAVLPAGNYILSDLTAGTSTMPHPFVNGAISTMYQPSDYHTSYAFIVSAHTITSLSPEFDGTSFK